MSAEQQAQEAHAETGDQRQEHQRGDDPDADTTAPGSALELEVIWRPFFSHDTPSWQSRRAWRA